MGRIQMFDIAPVRRGVPVEARKTLMITGEGRPAQDNSIYTKPPQPDGAFIYNIPPKTGSYSSGAPQIYAQPQIQSSYQPRAEVKFVNNRGGTTVEMPADQYDQLYRNANSDQFHMASNLGKKDFQRRAVGFGNSFATKFAEKTGTISNIGSVLLANSLKIQRGIVSNAQNQYIDVYAAKKTADLSEEASEAVKQVQAQKTDELNADPNNQVTGSLSDNTRMWSSTAGSGFLLVV